LVVLVTLRVNTEIVHIQYLRGGLKFFDYGSWKINDGSGTFVSCVEHRKNVE